MNSIARDYLMKRMERGDREYTEGHRGQRDYNDGRRDRMGRFTRDSRDYDDRRDMRDYEDHRDYGDYGDGRRRDMRDRYDDRRNRGTVDFEGSMDFADGRDYGDMRDYGHKMALGKRDMHAWKQGMHNEDGTHGPHYDMQQIMSVVEKMGIRFDEYSEKEFCMAVNMMYSDYCKVAKKFVAPDKELLFFAELAKAFLDDEDGPGGSEKLALYYYCIVDA